jgi:putative endonuclease
MNNFFVYFLKCNDGSYHINHAGHNIKEKIMAQKQGLMPDCYTYTKRPVELIYFEAYETLQEALKKEKQYRGWSRAKKEALMAGDFELIKQLSKKKFKKTDTQLTQY